MSSDLKMVHHKLKGLLQQSDQAMELIEVLKANNASEANKLIDQVADRLEEIAAQLRRLKDISNKVSR